MSIRTRALVAFLAPACLLFVLILGDIWFDGNLSQSEDAAARINSELSNAQVLLGDVLDAETSVRGYIATGNRGYLRAYDRDMGEIPERMRQFSDAASTPRAADTVTGEMQMLRDEVRLVQAGHRDAAIAQLASMRPRASLDRVRQSIRGQLDEWQNVSARSLGASRHTSDAWTTITHALAAVTIVGLLGAIWSFAFRLTGRIEQLNRTSLQIGRSEPLDPPMRGNDEIAMLDRALRRMADLIAERQAALDRHRVIVEIARDAIFFIDFDTMSVIEANPAACELYGYAHEELVGLPARFLRSAETRADVEAFFTESMGRGVSGEAVGLRKDGSQFPVDVTARGATIEGRSVIITVGRDATERHQARLELTAALDQAVRVSRLKSDFVATISHEIRTPMNGVIGMADLLLQTSLDAEQREFAETVRESGAALLRIIDEILDFSKIEAGKFEIESAPFDVRRTVEAVASLVGPNAAKKGIGLMTFLDSRLPSLVRGDAGRIRQVLINLVGNAVKFTTHGSVTLTVEAQEGQRVQFSVVDTGMGMSPDVLARLFTPFTQGDASTTRRFGGTGLGLSISHRLVELMGGKLDVESREGVGSRFWFSVPLPIVSEGDGVLTLLGRRCAIVVRDDATRLMLERYAASWQMTCVGVGTPSDPRLVGSFDVAIVDEGAVTLRERESIAHIILLVTEGSQPPGAAASLLRAPLTQSSVFHALDEALAESRHPVTAPTKASPLGLRVLLAEDNAVNQLVARKQLEYLGCEVSVVPNGRDAVARATGEHFDVVLMDCHMPEMDGFEAARAIREIESLNSTRVPIIALTAGAMEQDRLACLAAGMDDYLSKPINAEALRATLLRWVAKEVELHDGHVEQKA